jgi:hypothetical protein
MLKIGETDENKRKSQLDHLKSISEALSDDDKLRVFEYYNERLNGYKDFVFIIISTSTCESWKAEMINRYMQVNNPTTTEITITHNEENCLPSTENWQGTSKEQVLERIKLHKSGANLSMHNENWQQTSRSFELKEPPPFENIVNTESSSSSSLAPSKFKNTFQSTTVAPMSTSTEGQNRIQ